MLTFPPWGGKMSTATGRFAHTRISSYEPFTGWRKVTLRLECMPVEAYNKPIETNSAPEGSRMCLANTDTAINASANSEVTPAYKVRVDELYHAAAKRNSCYEAMVHSEFCARMISVFGDEKALEAGAQAAFSYARSAYGYMSPEELENAIAEDWEDGICFHGLTWLTCPAGCFEGD